LHDTFFCKDWIFLDKFWKTRNHECMNFENK
jgi:hypothetical protein